MLVAESRASQLFASVLGTGRGDGGKDAREDDFTRPAALVFENEVAAEILRQFISHGFRLGPGWYQAVTLNRHPQTPGERLHIISFCTSHFDSAAAAAAYVAEHMLYEGDDERFAAIIFTDRENGTSTLFAADGEAALSNSVAPA